MKLFECKYPCKLIFIKECGCVSPNSLQKYGLTTNMVFELKSILKKTYIIRVLNSFYAINEDMAKCIVVKLYD